MNSTALATASPPASTLAKPPPPSLDILHATRLVHPSKATAMLVALQNRTCASWRRRGVFLVMQCLVISASHAMLSLTLFASGLPAHCLAFFSLRAASI